MLVSETFASASENDLLRGEAIALPIAIVVMVFLLGGLVAAGMPLVVALGGVLTTLAVNYAFGARGIKLAAIDGGHWLLVLLVQGAILGAMGV